MTNEEDDRQTDVKRLNSKRTNVYDPPWRFLSPPCRFLRIYLQVVYLPVSRSYSLQIIPIFMYIPLSSM